jgi:hypothetical protein
MKKCAFLLFSLAVLSMFVGACGDDSGQSTPVIDTVAPNPPVGFQLEDDGSAIKITWESNAEADLAGYNLYKSSSENGPFGVVNSQALLCPWYFDEMLPGAMTFYKVTAVDESGNESAYSQVIGFYSRTGNRNGWDTSTSD